jgi:hypothetical protein
MIPTCAQIHYANKQELQKYRKYLNGYDTLNCFCNQCNIIRTLHSMATLRLKFEFKVSVEELICD